MFNDHANIYTDDVYRQLVSLVLANLIPPGNLLRNPFTVPLPPYRLLTLSQPLLPLLPSARDVTKPQVEAKVAAVLTRKAEQVGGVQPLHELLN